MGTATPRDLQRLEVIAGRYGVDAEALRQRAEAYETRPTFIISLAKNRLVACTRLIGEIVERRQAENVLRASEEELRKHRDHLEELVEERTGELKSANKRLETEVQERRRAEHLKDDFVSTVSRELRTPLAIAKEGVSLLIDGIPGQVNEKQKKVLSTAGSNIDRLARIINDLLDISKIESGKMEIEKSKADFSEIVRQTVSLMEQLAAQKGLEFILQLPEERMDVYVDVERIIQVLTNLLGNAVKFTNEGSITVRGEVIGNTVSCSVCDTGCGISDEDLPKVFDKFRQFGRKVGAGEKGTGLGLSIVRNILDLHRGQISIQSAVGKGTTFTFDLPLYTPERELIETLHSRVAAADPADKYLTLVILDVKCVSVHDPDLWAWDFQRAYLKLVESNSLVRDSDFVSTRQGPQIIVLADIKEENREAVCERWSERVLQCLHEVNPDLDVRVCCAFAGFPEDGGDAEALLERAADGLVVARKTAD